MEPGSVPILNARPSSVGQPTRQGLPRCPDEAVESTRVLSKPEGVKAVISSPRELVFRLDDKAPAVIDGVVEVTTDAQGARHCESGSSATPRRLTTERFHDDG